MTKLRYLGSNKEIKQGALELNLSHGDTFECSERLATTLASRYPGEFEEIKEFESGANKMYKKMTSFKSK